MNLDDYCNTSELADLFATVEGEAQSDGGLISAKVDHKGRVRDIWLDPKVSEVAVDQLAEAIAMVCGKAFDNRIDRLADVLDDFERRHGLPPAVLNFLRNSVASLRPTPPVPEVDPDTDEDDEEGPVLRSLLR